MTSANLSEADASVVERRPGWPEIIVGLIVMAVVGYGGGVLILVSGFDPVLVGLVFAAWSGIAALIAFGAAVGLRIRSWSAFGVRAVSWRWIAIGLGAGVFAFLAKGVAVMAYVQLTGDSTNPQTVYATGAGGGMGVLVLTMLLLGVLTPLGEEFLFRGVVTNALLRYGPFIGVVGSALIFALMHGINVVFPAAFVAGLVAGEVFRRSGSVWPAVMVHVVFNLPAVPALFLLAA